MYRVRFPRGCTEPVWYIIKTQNYAKHANRIKISHLINGHIMCEKLNIFYIRLDFVVFHKKKKKKKKTNHWSNSKIPRQSQTGIESDNLLTKHESFYLKSMNPKIPILYGLPKIHKINIPLRPIASYVNAPAYKKKISLWNTTKSNLI